MSPLKKNILYFDILRVIAVLAVVLLHINAIIVIYEPIGSSLWWVGNIFDSASRFCVPILVMLSGTLLLDPSKNESTIVFFRKRFMKVFFPFIAWLIIFYFFNLFVGNKTFSITNLLNEILSGPVYYHLWFLYMLSGLYLATPIIKIFIRNSTETTILYFLSLWFLFFSIFPFLQKLWNISLGIDKTIFASYVGYFILGHFLKDMNFPKHLETLFAFFIFILFVIITAVGTYFVSLKSNYFNELFYDYSSPNVILASISLYIFIKSLHDKISKSPLKVQKVITNISSASFGIYLIHVIIYWAISGMIYKWFQHPLLGIMVNWIGICTISFIGIIVLQKIPFIKHIVPK